MRIFLATLCIACASFIGACTIGVVTGNSTVDGRPIIFKTRDIDRWDLEFKVITSSTVHTFAANTYTSTTSPWMGVNDVGFGIVQSAAYNITTSGSGLNNFSLMSFVLKNCETVDEFLHILDSTDATGRATAANYAVFDAYGGAVLVECASREHAEYFPDSLGIVVRANFSYIGSSEREGIERMERAYSLVAQAIRDDALDVYYVATQVIADLHRPSEDPYPLPFLGTFGSLPAGWVETDDGNLETIGNFKTHAACVGHGVAPGMPEDLAAMWCFFATPQTSVPFVLFPASRTHPAQVAGAANTMLNLCRAKYDSAFHNSSHESWFDTNFLLNADGFGALDYILPAARWAFDTAATVFETWRTTSPTPTQMAQLQDTILARVMRAYQTGTSMVVATDKLPQRIELAAYPNPFNASCVIEAPANARIEIYDCSGHLIAWALSRAGKFIWTPAENIASGVFLVKCTVDNNVRVKKITLLK